MRHRSHYIRSLFLLLTLLTCIGHAQAQFQPMRLLSGLFRIGGQIASNLPAACMDSSARVPARADRYSSASAGISVTRLEGGREVATRPLSEVLEHWIRIRGNDSTTSVKVEPVKAEANVSYVIRVPTDKPAVVGTASQLNALSESLKVNEKAFKTLDSFANELKDIFKEENGLLRMFYDEKGAAEWEIVESLDSDISVRVAEQFIEDFKQDVAQQPKGSPDALLERLSVYSGRPLSDEQITKLSKLFNAPISNKYSETLQRDLAAYGRLRGQLRSEFGESHLLTTSFEEGVIIEFELGESDLSGAIDFSRKNILSSFTRDGMASSDLLSLYYGKKLTESQRILLEGITGTKVSRFSGRLDDHLLVSTTEDGADLIINTTTSSETIGFQELTPQHFRSSGGSRKRVVIDGPISDALAEKLRNSNVVFVRRFESFLKASETNTNQVKLIFVTSEDPAVAREIFEGQNVASVLRATKKIRSIPNSVIASTQENIDSALASLKPGEKAMVVLHDRAGELRYNPRFAVDDKGNQAEILSCNTYRFNEFGFPSVHLLDFEVVVDSLASTQQNARVNRGSFDDYMYKFHDNYERQSAVRKLYRKVLVVGGALGTTTIGYFIYTLASSLAEETDKYDTDTFKMGRRRFETSAKSVAANQRAVPKREVRQR